MKKNLFFSLREKIEEKIMDLYETAEVAIVVEWGMVETMTVSQYFPDKGFGFARRGTNGKRFFFHINGDVDNTGRRKEQKVLLPGQKIFVYETKAGEKGLSIVRWAEDNSFVQKKMEEMRNNFYVDEAIIRDISQEFFFQNLSDEEILGLGPVSASFRYIFSISGMQVEIGNSAFYIDLVGDEESQELFLRISYKDQTRKVKILTPKPFKCEKYGRSIFFFIETLKDYVFIENSLPKGVDEYIIGDENSQYSPEGQERGEYVRIEKRSDNCSIEKTDWKYALLTDLYTKILRVGATPNVGKVYLSNPLFEKEKEEWVCEYNSQEKFFCFSRETEKQKKIREICLPLLQAEMTRREIEKYLLGENPCLNFVVEGERIFSCLLSSARWWSVLDPEEVAKLSGEGKDPIFTEEVKRFLLNFIQEHSEEIQKVLIEKNKEVILQNFLGNQPEGWNDIYLDGKTYNVPSGFLVKYENKDSSYGGMGQSCRSTSFCLQIFTTDGRVIYSHWHGSFTQTVTVHRTYWGGGNDGYRKGWFSGTFREPQTTSSSGGKSPSGLDVLSFITDGPKVISGLIEENDKQYSAELQILAEYLKDPVFNESFKKRFFENDGNPLKNKILEGFTVEGLEDLTEAIKQAEDFKKQIQEKYEKVQTLITETEESFKKAINEVHSQFIEGELEQIRNFFTEAKTSLQKGEFEEAENSCRKAEVMIVDLPNIAKMRKTEREEFVRSNNIPEYLLSVFGEDLNRTIQFISNVAKIETWRLDSHEITCGRARASQNISDAWNAMGETTDFFCGADPNDVKYYVYEYHFGENATPVIRKEKKGSYNNNLSNSNDAMAEALRKAGLVK